MPDETLITQITDWASTTTTRCATSPRATRLREMKRTAIVRTLYGLMDALPESTRDQRWRDRRAEIPRLVDSAIGKFGKASTGNTTAFDPAAARLGDIFAVEPSGPAFIIDGLLPVNVGAEVAAGGTGKTTRHQFEHVHLVNALPLYGRKILKPGPVLVVTKEDTRAEFDFRYYHIANAMNLSSGAAARDERAHLH